MLKLNLHKNYISNSRSFSVSCEGTIEKGKSTGIYGKSGIGKTSVLRMIAGLENPDKGYITSDNMIWFDKRSNTNLLPSQRKIGFVFQDFNLFPNMTVLDNLKYASNGSIPDLVSNFIKSSELQTLLSSLPDHLSGGEKQRFSALRALSQSPELLLLDEPFSALDDDSILTMIDVINQAKIQMGITVIVVSHRKDILLKMTDSVIHMKSQTECVQDLPSNILEKSF
ncbi:MAG: molybdate transport system ATP-binding protein [Flavobacteriales bacterium]